MENTERKLFLLSLAAMVLLLVEILYNNTRLYTPTGRWFYPALAPVGLMILVAHRQLIPSRFAGAYRVVWSIIFPAINVFLILTLLKNLGPMPFSPPFS